MMNMSRIQSRPLRDRLKKSINQFRSQKGSVTGAGQTCQMQAHDLNGPAPAPVVKMSQDRSQSEGADRLGQSVQALEERNQQEGRPRIKPGQLRPGTADK